MSLKNYYFIAIAMLISVSAVSQNTSKNVTLLWDASYSMVDRDLMIDLEYLDLYFQKNPEVSLSLITFSNEIILDQLYNITNANWDALKKELRNTIYDGATNFDKIKVADFVFSDEVLLFSDGYSFNNKFPKISPTVTVISSGKSINREFLKEIAQKSGGDFIDFNAQNKTNKFLSEPLTIRGKVTDSNGNLPNVTVISKQNNIIRATSVTDSLGNYSIVAMVSDSLEFRYMGKTTVLTNIPSNGIKNINMNDQDEFLDEFTIENSNKEMINTGNGMVDKKRLGYSVKSISGNSISAINTDARGAVVGKFAGLEVSNSDQLSQFLGRGRYTTIKGNQYGLIVLDGVPIKQSNSSTGFVSKTNFINPENIESITYLKGLAATNIYGSQGSNGVLLIKSKTGSSSFKKKKAKKIGNTPYYEEDVAITNIINRPYIKEIKQTSSINHAYDVYLSQRKIYGKEINFFFDMASFFNNWKNPYLVKRILSNVIEIIEPADVPLLRALAYKYDEFGMFDKSSELYKIIIKIQPKDIQAYRNLALSYINNKEFKKAKEIYTKIIYNQYQDIGELNFSEIRKTITAEFKNLVGLNNANLLINDIPDLYKKKLEYHRRIVFEWSDYDAEFDLQIVNPQKRYFTWSHTSNSEPYRLNKEKEYGYGLEEFFITSKDVGEWMFNITYYGKKTGDNSYPTYLKITVYDNYGKEIQSEKITNINLQEYNIKETVLKLKV
ncbi:MAG: TonB-dependent receptor SusC [Flavobacterium sp. SCGC AAA160-P02]|nr:MAG: TonB-dependent receptor SusC [Flavobacterium sp. SCGC AAA160-P02]